MNAQQIDAMMQQVLQFLLKEISQSKDIVSALNKNSNVIMAICSVIIPIIDEGRVLFPQYAMVFDLVDALYKDAQSQGLIK